MIKKCNTKKKTNNADTKLSTSLTEVKPEVKYLDILLKNSLKVRFFMFCKF